MLDVITLIYFSHEAPDPMAGWTFSEHSAKTQGLVFNKLFIPIYKSIKLNPKVPGYSFGLLLYNIWGRGVAEHITKALRYF